MKGCSCCQFSGSTTPTLPPSPSKSTRTSQTCCSGWSTVLRHPSTCPSPSTCTSQFCWFAKFSCPAYACCFTTCRDWFREWGKWFEFSGLFSSQVVGFTKHKCLMWTLEHGNVMFFRQFGYHWKKFSLPSLFCSLCWLSFYCLFFFLLKILHMEVVMLSTTWYLCCDKLHLCRGMKNILCPHHWTNLTVKHKFGSYSCSLKVHVTDHI